MARQTKAALREQATQQQTARVRAALRWTEQAPPPDVLPPEHVYGDTGLSTGYIFNVYKPSIDVACSSSASHTIGRLDRTTSQRPLRLYSTRLLALQALRNAMERDFAEKLAAIDAQIEQERSK